MWVFILKYYKVMTVDGREDLFNYTYLNANGYLDKFRAALHAPSMTLPSLAALLKTFDKQYNLKNFITKNSKGKYCLYYKRTLDRLLGLGPNGRYNVNPALEAILQRWNENEISRKNYGYEPANYASDEEDMQKMSDRLANLEEGLNENPDTLEDYETVRWGRDDAIPFVVFNEIPERVFVGNYRETHGHIEKRLVDRGILPDNGVYGNDPNLEMTGRYWERLGIMSFWATPKNLRYSITRVVEAISIAGYNINPSNLVIEIWGRSFTKYIPYRWFFNGTYNMLEDMGLRQVEIMDDSNTYFSVVLNDDRRYYADTSGNLMDPIEYHSKVYGKIAEKKMNGKKITITESQFNELKKKINEQYFVETEKSKIVAKYLDDNFERGSLPAVGEDGYPKYIGVVGMKFKDGSIAKNMTATQLFYLLQDKFNKIYEDPKQRDAFLKKIVVDWYYKKVSKNGMLSRNNY